MSKEALHILDDLILQSSGRITRTTALLKDPSVNNDEAWYMCVPQCFNDALDIRKTDRKIDGKTESIWTQGSLFSFKAGDTLLDIPNTFGVWNEAMKTLGCCIQVINGTNASPAKNGNDRFSGSVSFILYVPDAGRSKMVERGRHTMSQDDFVRFLIVGPKEESS